MNQIIRFSGKVFILIGLLLGVLSQLTAADSLITVGIYQNPPKIFLNEEGQPEGIFVEVLEEIARLENWQLKFIAGTWNECMHNLGNGKIDLLPDIAYNHKRAQLFFLSTVPVTESWSQVYTRPDLELTNLADLKEKNIALVEGSVQKPTFIQLMNGFGYPFREVYASSFPEAFNEVKIGVADATLANHFFGESQYQQYGLVKTPIILDPVHLHFAVKKKEKKWIIESIDKHLTTWKQTQNSFYYKTMVKYLQSSSHTGDPHSHRIYLVMITLMLLTALLIFLFFRNRLNRQTKKLRETNKKLQYEEQKFRKYIEHAPYGVFVANENGKYIDVNKTACDITGYSKEDIIGKKITDLIAEEGKEPAMGHFNRVVSEGKSSIAVPYLTRSGEKRIWNVTASKITDRSFIGFVEDITDEEHTRNRLHLMNRIIDQSINELYLFDTAGLHFTEVNKAAVQNTGYTAWELKKMTPLDLKKNISPEQFHGLIQPLLKKEKKIIRIETQHFRKDGTIYEAQVYLQLLENEQEHEKLFSAVVVDVTDWKKSEEELEQIKERLEREVEEKTLELNVRIAELEDFREATIERELRMEELKQEIERLQHEKK